MVSGLFAWSTVLSRALTLTADPMVRPTFLSIKKGESHIDLSVLHLPDITGQFEWEDQRLGDKNLMMADCPLDPDTRKAVLTERVTFSASKWFGQVSTEVQLEQRLVESHRTFDKRFIPLAKGLRKVGIEV
jgi:hypothetical protein